MTDAILALLACPACGGRLEAVNDGLRCPADVLGFRFAPEGFADLRLPETAEAARRFSEAYRAGRLAEGWQPLTPEVARALPAADPTGYNRLYWPLRRETWRQLERALAGLAPAPLTVADAGAGFLWSSHRLAQAGHRVVAFDLSPDPDFGVGAAQLYPTALAVTRRDELMQALSPGRFLPLLADLERPPLATGRYDAVICNASLHYVKSLDLTLSSLGRALRPGGALIVLDSPVATQGWDTSAQTGGITRGNRVFGREELDAALRDAGLAPEWIGVQRGLLWARRQLVNRLRGRPGFEFPVVIARKLVVSGAASG